MIDFEKLKIAHELAAELKTKRNVTATICVCHLLNGDFRYVLTDGRLQQDAFESLDALIARLQELTQPKSKYKIGDSVWFVILSHKWMAIETEINHVEGNKYHVSHGNWLREEELYPTKEELIEEQIAYWHQLKMQCMLNQDKPELDDEYCEISGVKLTKKCQHESDGQIYKRFGTKYNSEDCKEAWNSCKKCGELYK